MLQRSQVQLATQGNAGANEPRFSLTCIVVLLPQARGHYNKKEVSSETPIRVACISDTHNNKPELPPDDVLIHAGDLTENGPLNEIQGRQPESKLCDLVDKRDWASLELRYGKSYS